MAKLFTDIPFDFDANSRRSPSQSVKSNDLNTEDAEILSERDRSIMMIASSILEGLALDLDHVRIDLAKQAANSPDESLLFQIIDFLEFAQVPQEWEDGEKDFSIIKAAIGRTLSAASSEDDLMEICFGKDRKQQHWVVQRLIKWLASDRSDMVVCSSIMLANLVRRGTSLFISQNASIA